MWWNFRYPSERINIPDFYFAKLFNRENEVFIFSGRKHC
jgi:hypothetical protein